MRIEQSMIIGRPVGEVFALVGNPDNDAHWGSLVVESQQITPGPIGKGTVFEQTATFLGGRLKTTIEITDFVPGRRVCYQANGPVALKHCRTFDEIAEGTRLTFAIDVEPGGAFRLPTVMVERMAARQVEEDLESIKTRMEAAPPSGG